MYAEDGADMKSCAPVIACEHHDSVDARVTQGSYGRRGIWPGFVRDSDQAYCPACERHQSYCFTFGFAAFHGSVLLRRDGNLQCFHERRVSYGGLQPIVGDCHHSLARTEIPIAGRQGIDPVGLRARQYGPCQVVL